MPFGFLQRSKADPGSTADAQPGTPVQHYLEVLPGAHIQPIEVPIRKPEYTPKRMLHPPKQLRVPDTDQDWGLWTRALFARGEQKLEHLKQREAARQARRAERARRFDDSEQVQKPGVKSIDNQNSLSRMLGAQGSH